MAHQRIWEGVGASVFLGMCPRQARTCTTYDTSGSEEAALYLRMYDPPLLKTKILPRIDNSLNIRAFCWVLMPTPLSKLPNVGGKTTAFGLQRSVWSFPLGDHQNSRLMPYVTKRQFPGENLDTQHRKRKDISPLRTRWLPATLLAWWVDKLWG